MKSLNSVNKELSKYINHWETFYKQLITTFI